MKNKLCGKTVVITGASSGIGEAMAKLYSSMGAKVVLGARSEDKLKALTEEIRANGGEAAYCAVDVVKAELIYFEGVERILCDFRGYRSVTLYECEISDSLQESVGNSRSSS